MTKKDEQDKGQGGSAPAGGDTTQGGGNKDKVPALKIHTKRPRFFRAGLKFSPTPRVIAREDLHGKIKALKAETMLIVEEVEVDADELTG